MGRCGKGSKNEAGSVKSTAKKRRHLWPDIENLVREKMDYIEKHRSQDQHCLTVGGMIFLALAYDWLIEVGEDPEVALRPWKERQKTKSNQDER